MTLKESARMWLNAYKAGHNGPEYAPRIDEWAELISEYLNQDDAESKVDVLHMDLAEAQAKNIHLREEIDEMRKQRDEALTCLRMRDLDIDRYRAKVEAYEFVIRCNGVSGAEVQT